MTISFRTLKEESIDRLDKVRTSIAIFEKTIESEKSALWDHVGKVIENIYPEDQRYYVSEYNDEIVNVESDLPTALRYSILVHTYSIFENILMQLCIIHKERKNLALSISDLKHEGIQKAKVYIKKVADSKFNEASKEWNEIVLINKIRNVLAHNDGVLLEGKQPNYKEIVKYITENPHINLNNYSHKIFIEKGFIDHVVEIFKTYLVDLFDMQAAEFEN